MTREEAIKVYNGLLNQKIKEAFEFFAPELAESEDERIRRFLIDILSHGTWRKEWPFGPNEVVAYLEKQKEQKPYEPHNYPADRDTLTQEQKPAEVCYGPKGDPDPAGVWKPSDEQMEANIEYIRKDALMELLQGAIQSYKTKNGFPAGTLSAIKIETLETVISRIEEICNEETK